MQGLVKLIMTTLYGVQIHKDINEFYTCKSKHWIQTESDDNVLEYWKLPNENYNVKIEKDDILNGDIKVKNTLPPDLGSFILSNSKRIMKNSIREINGFHNIIIFYGDADSLYMEKRIGMC